MRIETGSQAGTVVEVHDGNVQSPNPGADMMHGMMQSLAGGFPGGAGGGSMPSAYSGGTSGGYMGSQMPGGAGAVSGRAFAGMLPQYQHGPSCSSSGAGGAGLCGGMHPSMPAPVHQHGLAPAYARQAPHNAPRGAAFGGQGSSGARDAKASKQRE